MEENLHEETINTEQEQPIEEQKHTQNSTEVNIVKLREAKEKAERERAELAARVEELQKQNVTPGPDQEEIQDYGDEDFVEGKHLKSEIDRVKKQLEAYKAQQATISDEARLKQAYSDFDSVVNKDNLAKLKEMDPETAETIALSQASLYTRGAAAYKRIKELNLIVQDNHQQDRARAEGNVAKPRPMNSVSPQQGDSPLSMANAFANGLTPELKRQLLKEMQEASKKL